MKKGNSVMSGTMTTTVDGKQYKITLDNNKVTGLAIDGEQVPEDQLPSKYPLINSILRGVEKEANDVQDQRLQQQAQITSEKTIEAQREQLKIVQMDASNNARLITTAPLTPAPVAPPAPNVHVQSAPRVTPAPKTPLNSEAEKILEDMRKDGLIKDKNNLSFQLSKENFIVDGEKQPDEVWRRYKEKYIKKPSDTYMYLKSYNRTTISINN